MATRSGTQARRDAISRGMLKSTEAWRVLAQSKLIEAFASDMDIRDACVYAGIGEKTYYRWVERWPELRQKFDRASLNPVMVASQKLMTEIATDGKMALGFLRLRRSERYTEVSRSKVELSGTVEGGTDPTAIAAVYAALEQLNKNANKKDE